MLDEFGDAGGIPLNPTVSEEDAPRLSRQCLALLARLKQGDMTNVQAVTELRCLNYTARLSELKQAGYRIQSIRGERGLWTYRIVVGEMERAA